MKLNKDSDDSDGSPAQASRFFQKPKKIEDPPMTEVKTKPKNENQDLEDRTAVGFVDKEVTREGLVDFVKDEFKDVYLILKSAKNRILQVELDQSEVDHRIENVVNANKVLVQRLEYFGLRLDKLERTQMDDMLRVDKQFE